MDFDDALTPSGKSYDYKKLEVGKSVQGILQGKPTVLPHLKYGTNEQEKDGKGNPKWTLKVTLEIEGEPRSLFLVNSAYWAAIKAFQTAKSSWAEKSEDPMPFIGGVFGLKREEDGTAKPGFYAPKNYDAKFIPQTQ